LILFPDGAAFQGLEVISKIQKPLDEEEAAIMARMKQLLEQDSKEVGPLQKALPDSDLYTQHSAVRDEATESDSGNGTGSSKSSGQSITMASHQKELFALGAKLDVIHSKLKW
jgi:hypothetical protein